MNVQEIKNAVDEGLTVHYRNSSYTIIRDNKGQYLIKSGGGCIGLTYRDGVTLNGNEEDFYIP